MERDLQDSAEKQIAKQAALLTRQGRQLAIAQAKIVELRSELERISAAGTSGINATLGRNTRVRFVDLQESVWNGRIGEIVADFDVANNRFAVRVDDTEKVVLAKPSNLVAVSDRDRIDHSCSSFPQDDTCHSSDIDFDVVSAADCCVVCLVNRVREPWKVERPDIPPEVLARGRALGLTCSNGHDICLPCARRLVWESKLSPTLMKYDCPMCRTGCVIGVQHALALIKGTWDWRLPGGKEGTRTDIDP